MNCIFCGTQFATASGAKECPACERAIEQLGLGMTPDRLFELTQAEKDGRVMVLPPEEDGNAALYALYQDEEVVGRSEGDPDCALALLSYLACYVAEMMGTSYKELLAEMADRPSIVERAETTGEEATP